MSRTGFLIATLFWASFYLFPIRDCVAADSHYNRRVDGAQSVIVFVHGVLGDGESTWKASNNAYWPALLSSDDYFKNYSVYVYEYPTSFLNGPFSIDEISENMRLFFDADGISSYREIVFLAHSMGGLAVRAYLLKNRSVAARTRLTYFYSTPTTGSEIASLATLVSRNPQLAKMKPMQSQDYLADLQRQWLAANFAIPSFCAYETRPTYGLNVVTQASASNLCNRRLDPIDGDHITIVKPDGSRDARYLTFKSAIMQTPGFSEIPNSTIRRSAFSITHKQMLGIQGYVHPSSKTIHTAFINLSARFQDQGYNRPVYLRSLEPISAYLEQSSGRVQAVPTKANCSGSDDSELKCLLALEFDAQPMLGAHLGIRLGLSVQQQVVSDTTFKWIETKFDRYGDDLPWWIATSDVHFELERPNWLILTGAELLDGTKAASLLRIFVSNPTDRVMSIQGIELTAAAPVDKGISCRLGDPVQTVVLKWDLLRSGSRAAINTTLSGVELPVQTRYNFVGTCSKSYSFTATVPVSEAILPNSSTSVALRVKELPPRSELGREPGTRGFGSLTIPYADEPPTRLGGWPILRLGLTSDPASAVKPDSVDVRKP